MLCWEGLADFSGLSLSDWLEISNTSESLGWDDHRMQSACNFPMRMEQSAEKPWQLWPLAEFMMFIWCIVMFMFLMLGAKMCHARLLLPQTCCKQTMLLMSKFPATGHHAGAALACLEPAPNSGLSYRASWKKQFETVPTQDSGEKHSWCYNDSCLDSTRKMLLLVPYSLLWS